MTPTAAAQKRTRQYCQRLGINVDRLYAALRLMGREQLHDKHMMWTRDNPTQSYVLTEWLHRYHAPDGSQVFKVAVPGDEYVHRFNVWPDGSIIDLAAEQFANNSIDYSSAKPFQFMKTGGAQPSKRAQLFEQLYRGDSGNCAWRTPALPHEHAQRLLKDWHDPYGTPTLTQHQAAGGVLNVVRDDLISFGSKARFIDALIYAHPEVDEWVLGSAPAHGWAQISLSKACAQHNKRAVFFMAERSSTKLTAQQKLGLNLGGIYHWVPNGMLTVTQARARDYAAQHETRKLLPMGLEHPVVFAAIIKVATQLNISPKEVWTVASSGTLSRGLQMAFPRAQVHAVSVGHHMSERERGRAHVWVSPLKFTQSVSVDEQPPYASIANYDAKLWPVARTHAHAGALLWNVAADTREA